MRFKRRIREEAGLTQIDIAPLIDCIFLLLIFFMLTSSFIAIPGINVKLPRAITSEDMNPQALTVVISSEDIIYIQDKPITLKDVETFLKKGKYNAIFIKSDRNASLGSVVGVWDICKKFGIEKIGIATTYEE
ncbi:MAG: biopolymer transporter ExbD [Candidatus Omnitrophota bacterium]|nr:biopolymer transporter ExbD [Candidatus Omnitrophota bacterium]